MKKEFEFGTIGKEMPYVVEEEFFQRNADYIKEKITKYEQKRAGIKTLRLLFYSAAALILVVFAIGSMVNQNNSFNANITITSTESVDKILGTLSDNDLKQLEIMATTDPFLTIK
jgi:hypothetical protein